MTRIKVSAKNAIDDIKADDPRRLFLRHIHQRACGPFQTVLGPEANDAHLDHMHLDLAKHGYGAYCR